MNVFSKSAQFRQRTLFWGMLILGTLPGFQNISSAQKQPKSAPHRHSPIRIPGNPIIQRLNIPLEQPRRIVIGKKGTLYIADSSAGKILRLDKQGKVTTIADKLAEPSGLILDQKDNLYVSLHANGEEQAGSVVRVSPDGKQQVIAKGITGPKGLAFDKQGRLYVALFDENRIIRIDAKGTVTEFAKNVGSPAGIVFLADGDMLAVNSVEQTVSRITPKGQVRIFARGLNIPSDIALDADGVPVVANYGGRELSRLDKNGTVKTYLTVPPGTIGVAFNAQGNAIIVNWDLKMAVKITTRFSIPCPHCQKKIPVQIQPKRVPRKKPKSII
ncbi:MAG: hypothetical protein Tsb009_39950 [Planctomycetaceae bacterium]